MNARQVINRAFKGKNIMTPNILKCGFIGKTLVYELSQGTDFKNNNIYGVTIVKYENGSIEHLHDKSNMFYSKDEALNYIKSLEG